MISAGVADLVRAAAEGDARSWDLLVERYTPLLWSVARGFRLDPADAGDVVQTTWLRLLENLHRVHDPDHVGAWLATTARRECLRQLRRSGREAPSENEDLDTVDLTRPALDTALLVEERDAALWRAYEQLPERCRCLLRVLMADPPPSYDEVSAALEMPVGSIGPTRGRCLARLRGLLAGSGVTDEPASSANQSHRGRRP